MELSSQDEDLTPEQIAVLQKAFNSFDHQKTGSIPTEMVADILRLMGQPFDRQILDELIDEVDEDSKCSQPILPGAQTNPRFSCRIRSPGVRGVRPAGC